MGTDIHMIAERKINGEWKTFKKKVFDDCWEENKKTCIPYDCRNYNLFAILANVRNGYGFAGCKIGEPFIPISEPKGYPDDICEDSMDYMSEEHSQSWLTLKEIDEYDWNRMHRNYGVIDEKTYKETLMQGRNPDGWSGGISGWNIITLNEKDMIDLIEGKYPRNPDVRYYVECYFNPEPYKDSAEDFLENMKILHDYIPEGGTSKDVRIVFDFDS